MDNYIVIALIVILLWIVGFGVYLLTSNRQLDIESELEQVDDMLDDKE